MSVKYFDFMYKFYVLAAFTLSLALFTDLDDFVMESLGEFSNVFAVSIFLVRVYIPSRLAVFRDILGEYSLPFSTHTRKIECMHVFFCVKIFLLSILCGLFIWIGLLGA